MSQMHGKRSWVSIAVLLLAGATVFFTNLGAPRLWDRDEPRNAGCAAEMLQRGDWVVPVFNGELRDHKPVLLYWFIMSAYGLMGVSELAARFWSAALALGTALATYGIGRRLFGERAGFWSGVVLVSTMMFAVAARAATPDSVLIFFATMSIFVYVRGAFRSPGNRDTAEASPDYFPRRWSTAILMYALMGLAVLAKGPVGFVLPTAVIGVFLLLVRLPATVGDAGPGWRRWTWPLLRPFAPRHFLRVLWSMRPLTAALVVLAVALPWYVLVGLRTDGEFLRGFFLTHNFQRALQPMEGHSGPIVYYPLALCVGFLPWSLLFAPVLIDTVRRLRQGEAEGAGLKFLLCWVGVYVGVFSLARTKLPSYITPCYPAVAVLCGVWLVRLVEGRTLSADRWLRIAAASLAGLGAAALVGMTIAAHFFLPGDQWLGLIGLIPLAGGLLALRWLRGNATAPAKAVRFARARAAFAVGAVLLVTALMGIAAMRVDRHQTQDVLWRAMAGRSSQPRVAAFGCLEPSWVFYSGRSIKDLSAARPAEAAEFLTNPDAFVVTTDARYEQLKAELPADVRVVARTGYFLRRKQLLLLGCEPPASVTERPVPQHSTR